MARKLKLLRTVKKGQFVVYRSTTGKRRKFRNDQKLIAEVYSKRSKKRVGVLNRYPTKFTSKQRILFHEVKRKRVFKETKYGDSYRLYTKDRLDTQIPSHWVKEINELVVMNGFCAFSIEMRSKDFKLTTETLQITSKKNNLRRIIADMIVMTLRMAKVRTSAKKHLEKKAAYWREGNYGFYRYFDMRLIINT